VKASLPMGALGGAVRWWLSGSLRAFHAFERLKK
jgi:hypothetical protein